MHAGRERHGGVDPIDARRGEGDRRRRRHARLSRDGRTLGVGPRQGLRRASARTNRRIAWPLTCRPCRAPPALKIGLIEAYPFSSADAIESMVQMLRARGVPPAFLHMDVDWHALSPGEFVRDMKRLQGFAAAQNIPFGIIIVGYNGEADALYAFDAAGIAEPDCRNLSELGGDAGAHRSFRAGWSPRPDCSSRRRTCPRIALYAHQTRVGAVPTAQRRGGGAIGTASPRAGARQRTKAALLHL